MKPIYNKLQLLGICLISLLGITSCEKEIDVDLHSVEPRIVIEGLVKKDSLATVNVTTTKDFDTDNTFIPVSGAIVTISDNAGNEEVLKQNKAGLYVAKTIRGVENRTYNLSVSVDGKVYTSTSTMPQLVPIDSIKMHYIPMFKYAVPMVVFRDPAGVENHYRNILYLNRVRMDIGGEATDSKNRDGFEIERILPVFDDDKEDSRKVEKGDTVMVELQSIDKGAFTFFDSLDRIDMGQTNPTTNITGGALGYFSAYAFDRKSIIADWE